MYLTPDLEKPKKKSRKDRLIWGIVFLLAVWGIFRWFQKPSESPTEKPTEIAESKKEEIKDEELRVESHLVAEGDIPADIFSQFGKWDANDTAALLEGAEDIYDLSNLKLGKEIRFYFGEEERAKRMEYDRDTERMIVAERNGNEFAVKEEKIAYAVSEELVEGEIENFFYVDALEKGLPESTVLEMGDVFSFSIDFTTEIQKGDSFSVVFEKRLRDGKEAPEGRILAAKFVNEGTAHYVYYFDNDGKGGYYDGEGRVIERQFLKAPLSYRRISSGYTGARYHPVTRTVSAHYQIDYAAASGTPVVATARGAVVGAGFEGGWGKIIRLRHDNGFTTHYGHLSAFAKGIHAGANVAQGQVIGYVGSTGWSTGPHLDYGMKINGAPINPLKLDLPKGEPLSADKMDAFEEVKRRYQAKLK